MASVKFQRLLKPLLGIEGGVADRPKKDDPGGLTNKGVTQAIYDVYRAGKNLPQRSVRQITNAEVTEIYDVQFWRPVRGDDLPAGVDWCAFDFAVNSGPGRAVKELQRVLGVNVDGVIGMGTLKALADADTLTVIDHYCDRRLAFMKGLKNWSANKNGWSRRVSEVRMAAKALADPGKPDTVEVVALPATATAKAPEASQAQLKTPEGIGLTITAAGVGGEKVRQFAETIQPHMGMDTMLGRLAFVAFTLLMLVGGGLVGYAYVSRIREKGGLGGFVGSVFKGGS